jgi:hypothetical protein
MAGSVRLVLKRKGLRGAAGPVVRRASPNGPYS